MATSSPFVLNISKLSGELGISKEYVYIFIEYLSLSKLLNTVNADASGYGYVRKPQKVLLNNTNIINAINPNAFKENVGTIREIFFANQLMCTNKISMAKMGDFKIDDKYLIEVGGAGKTFRQIKNIINSYLAVDDIETGIGNKIPLYLFGLLY